MSRYAPVAQPSGMMRSIASTAIIALAVLSESPARAQDGMTTSQRESMSNSIAALGPNAPRALQVCAAFETLGRGFSNVYPRMASTPMELVASVCGGTSGPCAAAIGADAAVRWADTFVQLRNDPNLPQESADQFGARTKVACLRELAGGKTFVGVGLEAPRTGARP